MNYDTLFKLFDAAPFGRMRGEAHDVALAVLREHPAWPAATRDAAEVTLVKFQNALKRFGYEYGWNLGLCCGPGLFVDIDWEKALWYTTPEGQAARSAARAQEAAKAAARAEAEAKRRAQQDKKAVRAAAAAQKDEKKRLREAKASSKSRKKKAALAVPPMLKQEISEVSAGSATATTTSSASSGKASGDLRAWFQPNAQ